MKIGNSTPRVSRWEKIYIPADVHQTSLETAVRAVDELSTLLGTMTSDTLQTRLTEQLRALDSRVAELEQLPASESRWEYRLSDTVRLSREIIPGG